MAQPINHTEPGGVPKAVTQVRKKSVLREYVEAILIAILLALLIRTFIVQAFKIPSGSMLPTLQVGDHILVNKFIYQEFRIPRPGGPLVVGLRDPARGDIIVFKYPQDEHRDFIKRVIAVGGETVFVKDQKVFINCQPPESTCQAIREPWAYYEQRLGAWSETSGPHRVPPGSYFVMGDNRHNSQDSRYWGFVKREKIKGKAFVIYWSWDSERDGLALWKRVRWSRLGHLIY